MGSSTVNPPSRFLRDIPRHLITGGGWWQGEESLAATMYSWNRASAPSLTIPELKAGDHVRHTQFGDGVVVSCQTIEDDEEVVVAFTGRGVKKLLLSFAHLEKVD